MRIKKRKKTFVLIVPRFEDIFHSFYAGEIIKGVGLGASRLNFDILVHITDRSDHRGWLDSSLLDLNFIDGIIFADIDNDLTVVRKAIRQRMPCLVLNNVLTEPINWIAINNKQAAFNVTEHLIFAGHKKIATIAGDLTTQAGVMRLEGFKEALRNHDVPLSSSYVTHGEFLRTPARKAAEKLLKLLDRPTAIFAASDVMALELMNVAKLYNIVVPDELSIIGFDDNPICHGISVPLTTVSQPLVEMGRLGLEHLHQITEGKAQLPVKFLLAAQLIERDTVKVLKE